MKLLHYIEIENFKRYGDRQRIELSRFLSPQVAALVSAEDGQGLLAGHRRETWSDPQGRAVIERYDIRGMGHGTPLDTRDGEACGTAGPHMLEARICSTRQIAATWGLTADGVSRRDAPPPAAADIRAVRVPPHPTSAPAAPGGAGAVIEDALRAAGLMR